MAREDEMDDNVADDDAFARGRAAGLEEAARAAAEEAAERSFMVGQFNATGNPNAAFLEHERSKLAAAIAARIRFLVKP